MNRILVGLDGSVRERAVLDAAAGLAEKTGAKLILLRCVGLPDERDLPPDAYAMAPSEIKRTLEQRAEAGLEKLAANLPAAVVASRRVMIAAPWQAIDRIAKEEDVDLIVIGSHGYDALDRILGTTAAKVVNHAPCSVLVVREPRRVP